MLCISFVITFAKCFRPKITAIILNVKESSHRKCTFYVTVVSLDDDSNSRPKHVVYVINKWWMSEHLWCCTERITIENLNWTNATWWCYPKPKCTLCPSINSRSVLTLVQITGSAQPNPSLSCLLEYKLLDFRTMTNIISGHHDRLLFPLLEVGSFIIPMRPPSSVYISKWSELTQTLSFFFL